MIFLDHKHILLAVLLKLRPWRYRNAYFIIIIVVVVVLIIIIIIIILLLLFMVATF